MKYYVVGRDRGRFDITTLEADNEEEAINKYEDEFASNIGSEWLLDEAEFLEFLKTIDEFRKIPEFLFLREMLEQIKAKEKNNEKNLSPEILSLDEAIAYLDKCGVEVVEIPEREATFMVNDSEMSRCEIIKYVEELIEKNDVKANNSLKENG
jgi:hypothetical protein